MRIALDARTLYSPQRRGIGRTLRMLYQHVAALRPQWRIQAFHRQTEASTEAASPLLPSPFAEPRRVEMPGDRFDAWQRLRLPLAAWRQAAHLLHCPANFCPAWMPVPTLVTLHDLIPLDMPHGRPASEVRRFEQSVRWACQRAAMITTPSRYVHDRLIHEFHADPKRLRVVPWAADPRIVAACRRGLTVGSVQRIGERYGIEPPFVLHFGAGDVRKNTRRVIEAWAMLKRSLKHDWKLLVVGLDGQTQADLMRSVTRLGIEPSVRLHGFADEADIPALLAAAAVLAYPSLSEGFGLPILDAFTADTAVLTAEHTSLPEIAADAACYVDATDAHSIATGLTRLLREPIYREQLVQRGRERLTDFSWDATAQAFIDAVIGATFGLGDVAEPIAA